MGRRSLGGRRSPAGPKVERFQPELHRVLSLVGHLELLVQLRVGVDDAGGGQRLPSDVAETARRGIDNGGGCTSATV
jgi:hypothetical protein